MFLGWFIIVITAAIIPIDSGEQLMPDVTYMILAPKKIYPNEVIQVQLSIFRMFGKSMTVRGNIRKNGVEEYARFNEIFEETGTRLIQMRLRDNADIGNYTMRVEAFTNNILFGTGYVFENETKLLFDVKQVSVFIQTSKPLYCNGQTVYFRLIPVKPNLLPVHGDMDIFAIDPTGLPVRRWLSVQTNAGILDMKLPLSDQPRYGTWKIQAVFEGAKYEKEFQVEQFFMPRFFVNISMPLYIMEDAFGLAGLITANHTSGEPAKGSGKIRIEIRNPLQTIKPGQVYKWPSLEKPIYFFHGRSDFIFFMDELRELNGNQPVSNKELYVEANIYDWILTQNSTGFGIAVVYENKIKLKLLGDKSRTFKPGFPVQVFYAVEQADGSPLASNRRQITVQRSYTSISGGARALPEEKLVVRDDGIVSYSFIAENNAQLITIQAYYDLQGYSNQVECKLFRFFSHSAQYIKISTTTESPKVDTYMIFTVHLSTFVETVYYLIISGGNIQTANSLEMSSTQKTFSVALSRDMVPSSRILAYFIYKGEVIVDSLNFFVNGSGMNPVYVNVNKGKDFSRDTVEVTVKTDRSAFVAISGVDYELWSHGGDIFLTEEKIINELETYDSHSNYSYSQTWYLGEAIYRKVFFPSATYGVDANTTFIFAGLVIMTDANVSRIIHNCNETLGFLPCNNGNCFRYDERCDGVAQCEDSVDEMGCNRDKVFHEPFTPHFKRFKHVNRHYLEEGEFLWKSYFVKPDGRIDMKTKVPKEPMAWLVGAISLSRTLGLGVLDQPARHQGTRQFYIRLEAPTNIIRGEQIGVRVALFNYWDMNLECLVTVHDSDDYRIVLIEEFGYVKSYSPRTTRGDIQTMVYVRASEMKTIYFPVIPIKGGNVTVVISATSFMGRDNVSHTFNIQYDGVVNYYHTPLLVDLVNTGSDIIPDLWIIVPDRFFIPEQKFHNYVPGSPKATVSISGDIVGSGFFEQVLTAMNMMRKPYGSAEQNMFNLASNINYLIYFKETNQLRREVLLPALDGVNVLLQRQMSYYMPDIGAFTMFRDHDQKTPSLWMTAFALQTLQKADLADWRLLIFIPNEMLYDMALWISTQQQADGSFYDYAPIYDKRMSSKIDNVTLTAFVLTALNDADDISSSQVENARRQAKKFLENQFNYVKAGNDTFQKCIYAYALAQSESSLRYDAHNMVESIKRISLGVYWSPKPIPKNPMNIVATIQYQNPRHVYPDESTAVAATSYALMMYLKLNIKFRPTEIMKWLQSMRNTIGGFSSTQDTILALRALIALAKEDMNRRLYKMKIMLQATSTQDWNKELYLNSSNYVDTQTLEIPKVWGSVRATAQGTGISVLQLGVQMNVEFPIQQYPTPNGTFFDVNMDNLTFYGRNFSIMEATACTKWKRADISDTTGLVVMEIDLPTGYVILNDVLRTYVQSGQVKNLARAEYLGRKVIFYFEHLQAHVKSCVHFRADRWYPVANGTIQHKLFVYDYYEAGMFNLSMYDTQGLFNLHMCQVCGSYQCPYCEDFNSAIKVKGTINNIVSLVFIAVFSFVFFRELPFIQ